MYFANFEYFGEPNDKPCKPTRFNSVALTKTNGAMLVADASWFDWDTILVFPDNEKAKYFVDHFKSNMRYFHEAMKGDFIYHNCCLRDAKDNKVYADQLKSTGF